MTRDEFKDLLMDCADANFDCGWFSDEHSAVMSNGVQAKIDICILKAKDLEGQIMEAWDAKKDFS